MSVLTTGTIHRRIAAATGIVMASVLLSRVLGSPEDAEDVVQEALLRIHEAELAGSQIHDPEPFALTVTARVAIDQLRSARVKHEYSAGSTLPDPPHAGSESGPVEPGAGMGTGLGAGPPASVGSEGADSHWVRWHGAYEDPSSNLSARLRAVILATVPS